MFVKLFYGTIGNLLKACGLCSTIISYKLTFNIPNFNDRSTWQSSVQPVGYKELGSLPNITGTGYDSVADSDVVALTASASGALYCSNKNTNYHTLWNGARQTTRSVLTIDASRSSSCYGRSGDIVIPTAVVIKFCIKY